MVKCFKLTDSAPENGGPRGFIIVTITEITKRGKSLWRVLVAAVMVAAVMTFCACREEPPPRPAVKNRIKGVVKAEDWPKAAKLPQEWQDLFQRPPGRDLLFTPQPIPSHGPEDAQANHSSQDSLLTIQVGSFRRQKAGLAEVERLRNKGLDVFLQSNTIDTVTWYRICHGYFRDESLAKETARKLVQSRRIKSYSIIRVREDD